MGDILAQALFYPFLCNENFVNCFSSGISKIHEYEFFSVIKFIFCNCNNSNKIFRINKCVYI